jgi:transcriptional regulator with XRE-family HTH domain
MKQAKASPVAFADRVRELLAASGRTITQLADDAELAPSLVSKLLTETETSRREPRLEHVLAIARALGAHPREVVLGTTAEPLLGEYLPRDEFDKECAARSEAQAAASEIRMELAGARSELVDLKGTLDRAVEELRVVKRRAADVEAAADRERHAAKAALAASEGKRASAIAEYQRIRGLANQNYAAWANAKSMIALLQRELTSLRQQVTKANGEASAAWVAALIGTVGGAVLGHAAAEDDLWLARAHAGRWRGVARRPGARGNRAGARLIGARSPRSCATRWVDKLSREPGCGRAARQALVAVDRERLTR